MMSSAGLNADFVVSHLASTKRVRNVLCFPDLLDFKSKSELLRQGMLSNSPTLIFCVAPLLPIALPYEV